MNKVGKAMVVVAMALTASAGHVVWQIGKKDAATRCPVDFLHCATFLMFLLLAFRTRTPARAVVVYCTTTRSTAQLHNRKKALHNSAEDVLAREGWIWHNKCTNHLRRDR